jgi:lipid II:glycine glycyltransferase (peptidoglycan interpeptide bridge formation enzyme)
LRGHKPILFLPTAPAIVSADRSSGVRGALFEFARTGGSDRVQVEPGYGTWLTADESLGSFRTGSITEFIIALNARHEELLSRMHKVHRKNVRRAARNDLEVVEDSSIEGLLVLRHMQLSASDRGGTREQAFAVPSEATFRSLHENVYARGIGHVFVARLGDEPVAALAWLEGSDKILTVRSGSSPEGYDRRAMYLLHDALIRRGLEHGFTEMNIGGVPTAASQPGHDQAGLYEFKAGFGSEPHVRYALDIPVKEIRA